MTKHKNQLKTREKLKPPRGSGSPALSILTSPGQHKNRSYQQKLTNHPRAPGSPAEKQKEGNRHQESNEIIHHKTTWGENQRLCGTHRPPVPREPRRPRGSRPSPGGPPAGPAASLRLAADDAPGARAHFLGRPRQLIYGPGADSAAHSLGGQRARRGTEVFLLAFPALKSFVWGGGVEEWGDNGGL